MAEVLLWVLLAFLISVFILIPVALFVGFYLFDQRQKQHAVLRNYPLLGRVRYFLEMIGPEMRQYLFDHDNEGKPFSRVDYQTVVFSAKYGKAMIAFGSRRDFEAEGFYLRNSLFPKLSEELWVEKVPVSTKKYHILKETLISRKERQVDSQVSSWLLKEEDAVVIGANRPHPFRVRGLVGMSGMSYGALGENAITALSEGLGLAGETWMNTGEGGISPYHLKGDVDLIMQIGPGLFGVRNEDGTFSWDKLREWAAHPKVRAFELKLGQGAKIRGGHLEGSKVSPEIAAIRGIPVGKTVDSPNRFKELADADALLSFVHRMQRETGKPIGIKLVVGAPEPIEEFVRKMVELKVYPDFITVDGGEGGTGATYQELADSVGLPLHAALPIVDEALKKHGIREEIVLFASGKLYSPDRIAIALALGADLVNIARGFMIAVGCIQAMRCHTNQCPVGVATTDPRLQKALVVEEKKYRVANYVLALREGLFHLAAAAGLESPRQFSREHVVYKDRMGRIYRLDEHFSALSEKDVFSRDSGGMSHSSMM
jgi:glutamate synthase domain-containing protein 2